VIFLSFPQRAERILRAVHDGPRRCHRRTVVIGNAVGGQDRWRGFPHDRDSARAADLHSAAGGCGPDSHAQWLYEQAVNHAVTIDRQLLVRPAPQKTALGYTLNLLAGAALAHRQRLELTGVNQDRLAVDTTGGNQLSRQPGLALRAASHQRAKHAPPRGRITPPRYRRTHRRADLQFPHPHLR